MADSPAAEIALDEDGIRDLLRASAPDLADLPLRLVAEGWDNAVWRLGEDLAVRIPRRAVAAELIEHEQRWLPEIDDRLAPLGVATPRPVRAGRPAAGFPWPWSVVAWAEGISADRQPQAERRDWAQSLGRTLLALHVEASPDHPVNPVRGVPLALRDDAMRENAGLVALDRPRLAAALLACWDEGLDAAPHAGAPIWIHGDLHPANIVVAGPRLAALVDFGDVTAGDPAYDLAISWLGFDAAGRAEFRSAFAGQYDADAWRRARAWAAAVTLILLARSDDRPAMAAIGETAAIELVGTVAED
ncbi:aminoglycoside phosphotransferase (APT) family kinase protein [Microbacterium resistens]|uniref:Aminoglycoside phosphotransferase (APT) family kinase protein n=1 Tax=Microbacterium resistens TaxID=156977 RepID=A0ABU1S8J2_9MICO|nr:aminoglycoside phosphotransferase family protein [Microbacterium resistens]MDR6865937.1 aminoglycoside phosphotransferase (APT) family kinase protein [Microbacterium resistens]